MPPRHAILFFALFTFFSLGPFQRILGRGLFAEAALNNDGNRQLASGFGATIAIRVDQYSGYDILKSIYDKKAKSREFSIHSNKEGKNMIQKMAKDLAKLLKKKQDAVKKLVRVLEDHSRGFDWDNNTYAPNYYNVEFLNEDPEEVPDEYKKQSQTLTMKKDSRFQDREVNVQQSVVQVPFDVYSNGEAVTRGIQWSKVLNDQFIRNAVDDPTLKWQYFGSTEGFLRVFPGYKWKLNTPTSHPNIYDCRNRNWYTEAATYPKDMLILVDNSGSMKGLKMSVAAHVVATLLQTLGDNDFFNVMTYSNEVSFVEPCFNGTLVRADDGNKDRVLQLLRKSNTTNVADLSKALNVSFNIMGKFYASGGGSDCYSSIMIITDGATNSYQKVMDAHRNMTKRQTRIFSYLIGADKSYLEPVRDIACNNYGFFQQVESRNDVSEKVLHYLTVMNRPQAFGDDHHMVWTKPYYDTTNLDLGFGLVTTVASPVYLKKKPPRMLGVAATDVPVSLLLNSINVHKPGVNAYVFIVTNNGYVVAHPRLQTMYTTKFGRDKIKPNYNSIDIESLEWSDVNDTLRDALLRRDKDPKPLELNVVIPLDEFTRAMKIKGTYRYAPINETPFSLGIFQPSGYGEFKVKYGGSLKDERRGPTYEEKECDTVNLRLRAEQPHVKALNRVSAICSLNFSIVSVSEAWQYCSTKDGTVPRTASGATMSQLDMIKTYAFGKDDNINCDDDLINSVLFDVFVTAALVPIWSEHNQYRNETKKGIEMAFMMGKSGATRHFWHKDSSPATTAVQNLLNGFDRQTFPSFYRRTAAYPETNVWLYSLLSTGLSWEQLPNYLLVTRAIRRGGAILGVHGLVMATSEFTRTFWDETNAANGADCSQGPESKYVCYIIDDNGAIITSSAYGRNDVGRKIDEVDRLATRHLLSKGVFSTLDLYNYGTMCTDKPVYGSLGGSATSNFMNPFRSVFAYVTWWTKEFAIILTNMLVWNVWSLLFNAESTEANFEMFESKAVGPQYRVCDKKYQILTVNSSMVPYNGTAPCEDVCKREIGVYPVKRSNLFLLVVEKLDNLDCDCSNGTEPVLQKEVEIEYAKTDKCARLRAHKLRRKPNGCVGHHNVSLEDNPALQCFHNAAESIFRSNFWVKVNKPKTSQGSYSYFMLSLSWFLPYFIIFILNLTDEVQHLSPFI